MKYNVIGTSLVLACAATWAAAQDKLPQGFDPAKAMAQMQQQMQQQLLQQFDANKDGKLTGQEQLMAQEAMRRQGINLGIPPGGFAGEEQFKKQFDRDGDGKLNQAEAMAAQAAYQKVRNNGMKSGPRGGGVASGGPIPQQPLQDAGTAAKQKDKVPPLIKRFDKDGDGKLNAEEKAAAQAELKKAKTKDGKEKGKDGKDKDKDDDDAGDAKGK